MRKIKLFLVIFLATLVAGTGKVFAQVLPVLSVENSEYEYYIYSYANASRYVTTEVGTEDYLSVSNTGECLKVKFVPSATGGFVKAVPTNVPGQGIIAATGKARNSMVKYYADEAAADAAGAFSNWEIDAANGLIYCRETNQGWNLWGGSNGTQVGMWDAKDSETGSRWVIVPANDNALAALNANYATPFTGELTANGYISWQGELSRPAAADISVPSGYYRLRNADKATFYSYVYNDGSNTRAQVPNPSELVKNNYVWKVTHTAGSATVGFQDGNGRGIYGKASLTLGVSDYWAEGIIYFTEGMHVSNQSHLTVNGNATNPTPAATQANPFKTTGWDSANSRGSAYYLEPVDISLDVYAVAIENGGHDTHITRTATGETAPDGGFFVYAKGAVPAASDFTATAVEGTQETPNYTIDPATKTITVTYVPNIDPAVFALHQSANEAQIVLDGYSYGTRPGLYPEALKTALQQKIDAALAVADPAAVSAASSELSAALSALQTGMIQPAAGQIYMFVNGKTAFAEGKALFSDFEATNLMWGNKDQAKNSQYWMLVADGGEFKVKNGDGLYMASNGATENNNSDAVLFMSNAAGAGKVVFSQIGDDQWHIKVNNSAPLHPNGHSGGQNGYVICWDESLNSPSAWKLDAITGYDIYNVVVTGAEHGAVAYTNGDKAGNGGFFVIPAGPTPTEADFTAVTIDYYDVVSLELNTEAKTVTVVYTYNDPALYRRESTLLPGNTYMMFNAGTVAGDDWTGMLYYEDGVKVDRAKKPSGMSTIEDAYKWTVAQDATGYKLYTLTDTEKSIDADCKLSDEYLSLHQYFACEQKCGDDVWVLLEDETSRLVGSATTAEHNVYAIHNPQTSWGWATNAAGMIPRDKGYFPYAFYTQYRYTNSQWALYLEAKDAIANAGKVGYPQEDNATGAEIKALLLQDPATEGWAADVQDKLDAYKAITDIQMPENGKAYTFTSVQKNGKRYYFRIADGRLGLVSTSAEGAAPETFVCRVTSDDKYVFVNNSGEYLLWCHNSGKDTHATDGGYNANKGIQTTYDANNALTVGKMVTGSSASASNETYFGYLMIRGKRAKNDDPYFVINQAGTFDGANAQFWNDNYSSALLLEEVEYPNTPELKAADGIDGIEAIATWSAPFATVVPEGVEAYMVSSEDGDNASVEKLEGEAIPANTGVLLTGDAGKVTMVPATTESVATVTTNLLANTAGAAKAVGGKFVLAKQNDKVAFYVAADGELGMNKAYLDLSGNGVRAISFDFGGATAIESVEAQQNGEVKTYDLSGRRVNKAVKGLYIQNGKKVIVK